MGFREEEVPLILIVFLGALGSAVIIFYRNFLCAKESSGKLEKTFVCASLFASLLGVIGVMCENRKIILFNWILSGLIVLYSILAFFLPSGHRTNMITWSDFFLVGLTVSFFLMRCYASLLLTYDRMRQKNKLTRFLRPIPKPFDLYTIDQPNSTLRPGFIINNNMPTIV